MTFPNRDAMGELLSAYIDGEVSGQERAEVEALLAESEEARRVLAELREAAAALRTLPREPAPPFILADITARIERDELLGSDDEATVVHRYPRRPIWSLLGAAAFIGIAIGGGLYVSSELSQRGERNAGWTVDQEIRPQSARPEAAMKGLASRDDRADEEDAGRPVTSPDRFRDLADFLTNGERSMAAVAEETATEATGIDKGITESTTELDESNTNLGLAMRHRGGGFGGSEYGGQLGETSPEADANVAFKDDAARTGRMMTMSAPPEDIAADGLPDAERTEGAAGADGAVAASPPQADDRTLEAKLAAGLSFAAVQSHPFEAEPLHLTLVFATAEQQAAFSEHLRATFATQETTPATPATPATPTKSLLNSPKSKSAAGETGASASLFYEGRAPENFTGATGGEQQFILRVPPGLFDGIIADATVRDIEGIQFGIGSWTVSGVEAVRDLARTVLGDQPSPATESDPAPDLLAILGKLKLTPAGLADGSQSEEERTAVAGEPLTLVIKTRIIEN
jgi:anti-sigma factor RsiW